MAQRTTHPSRYGSTSTCLTWILRTGGPSKPVVSLLMSPSKGKAIPTAVAGLRIRHAILGGLLPRYVKTRLQDCLFTRVRGRDLLREVERLRRSGSTIHHRVRR